MASVKLSHMGEKSPNIKINEIYSTDFFLPLNFQLVLWTGKNGSDIICNDELFNRHC